MRFSQTRCATVAFATLALSPSLVHTRAQHRLEVVSFPNLKGVTVQADLYGAGESGVILVGHGGYSTKESWARQAEILANASFRVLAFTTVAGAEFANTGKESACLYDEKCLAEDVLSAVGYLRQRGATSIDVIGGSMGGAAVAQASVEAGVNEIDRIVLLAPASIDEPERIKGRKLFIATREDANASGLRLPGIQQQYARAPEPKRLILLDGSAHGQRIFETDQGTAVMKEIIRFLRE